VTNVIFVILQKVTNVIFVILQKVTNVIFVILQKVTNVILQIKFFAGAQRSEATLYERSTDGPRL